MKSFPPAKIRNVALVGHGGAGKTSLTESLLFCAGAISRHGRVEDGNTTTDFDPEEIRRGISLSLALAPFEYDGHKINLLDTPGYADFVTDVLAALRVADLAVIVVSAVEGPEVGTDLAWTIASAAGLPRMFFINKLDRERANFQRTVDELRNRYGGGVAPLVLPIGEETAFRGVADVLTETAYVYEGATGKGSESPIPPELQDLEKETHERLVESIVESDDELMERYLAEEPISPKELRAALAKGVLEGSVFPLAAGSATKMVAIDRLAALITDLGPSPQDRPPVIVQAGGSPTEVKMDPAGQPLALVYRTVVDQFVGKVSFFKVLSGTVRPDANLTNPRTHTDERLHALFTMRGKEQDPVPEVPAGDIGSVAKLANTGTGDTLAPKGTPVVIPPLDPPVPVLSIAITPKTKGDEDKLMTGIHRLQEEDVALQVRRDDETHQTVLSGMGETHLALVTDKLARRFGVEVATEEVRLPYRETILGSAEAEGKHKKQSGGHGQFGVAFLKVEPRERGEGFEFVDKIVGGAIPRQFIPAVEKGVAETMSTGGVFGYPIVDVRVTLFDGKFHAVDSSEMSFRMAGSLALKEAMGKANPVMLEPVSLLEVTVPSQFQGDVMGDLNSRRGRVQGTEAVGGGEQMVTALVPTSEILRYSIDLRSLTGGRGRFAAKHSHYDLLPAHLVDKVKKVE